MKRPTTINLILGSIIGLINNRFYKPNIYTPKKVSGYRLVSEIQKNKKYKKYGTGLYMKGNEVFFIKTWSGLLRDYDYYSLIKEYNFSKILSSVVKKHPNSELRFPEPVKLYHHNNRVSVVYKYIDGVHVETLGNSRKAESIANAIEGLSQLSEKLNKQELNQFPIRNHMFYLLTLPLITVLALVFNVSKWKIIIHSSYLCVRNFSEHNSGRLILAHGDLHPGNLILGKNKNGQYLNILDCENMILTYADYDLSLLTLDPEFSILSKELASKLKYPASIFLMTYIGLHCAITDNDIFLATLLEKL